MKIKNIHECGWDIRPAALGLQLVRHGEEVEVDPKVAAVLLIQTDVWSPVDDEAKKLARRAIATQAKILVAASAGMPVAIEMCDPDVSGTEPDDATVSDPIPPRPKEA